MHNICAIAESQFCVELRSLRTPCNVKRVALFQRPHNSVNSVHQNFPSGIQFSNDRSFVSQPSSKIAIFAATASRGSQVFLRQIVSGLPKNKWPGSYLVPLIAQILRGDLGQEGKRTYF